MTSLMGGLVHINNQINVSWVFFKLFIIGFAIFLIGRGEMYFDDWKYEKKFGQLLSGLGLFLMGCIIIVLEAYFLFSK